MSFYKNPIFLGIIAFLCTTGYVYYDVKKKLQIKRKYRDNRLKPDPQGDTISLVDLPWYLPITVGTIVGIFSYLYFGDDDKLNKNNSPNKLDKVSSFSSDNTDEISENYAIPEPKNDDNINIKERNNEDVLLELWNA